MSGFEVATLALALVGVIAGISWGVLISTWKSLIKNATELRDIYQTAMADGTMTDKEKAQVADKAVEVIEDVLTLWQQSVNIFSRIKKIVIRK